MGRTQLNACVYGSLHVNGRWAIATDLTEIQKSVREACDAPEANQIPQKDIRSWNWLQK